MYARQQCFEATGPLVRRLLDDFPIVFQPAKAK
jgi:hypothetical protein